MKLETLKETIRTAIDSPEVFIGNVGYIFVLSHMRSYSSLLSHILGSHPEIQGYRERHRSYLSNLDLLRFRFHSYKEFKVPAKRYLLDKILQGEHKLARELLENKNNRFIFLLREPEPTLKSIINMGLKHDLKEKHQDPQSVLNYYEERMNELIAYSNVLRGNALFIKGESLISNTEAELAFATTWLGISPPLSPNYTTFEQTGSLGAGDPSPSISSGKILQKKNRDSFTEIHIPAEILNKAAKIYTNTCSILTSQIGTKE